MQRLTWLLLLAAAPLAAQAAPDQPVNPRVAALFPAAYPGPVFDSARVLHPEPIIEQLTRLRADTKAVVAVVTIPSLQGLDKADVATGYGRLYKIGAQGEIGSATRSLGAVVLVVPKTAASGNKGSCFIAPATGAEGVITDGTAGQLCRDAVDYFRRNDYDGGVQMIVAGVGERIRSALAPVEAVHAPNTAPQSHGLAGLIVLGVLIGGPILFGLGWLITAPARRRKREAEDARRAEEYRQQIAREKRRREEDEQHRERERERVKRAEEAERVRWNALTPAQQRAELAERERARAEQERLAAIRRKREAEEAAARRKRQEEEDDDRRRRDASSSSSWSSSDSGSSSSSSGDSGGGGSYSGGGGGSDW
jgi:uncharacterized membrane protein YgcG